MRQIGMILWPSLLLKPAELQEIGTLLIAMKLTAVGKGPWYVSLLVQKKKKTKTSSIPEVQRTGDLSWLCWLQMLGWRFPVVSSILASGSLLVTLSSFVLFHKDRKDGQCSFFLILGWSKSSYNLLQKNPNELFGPCTFPLASLRMFWKIHEWNLFKRQEARM